MNLHELSNLWHLSNVPTSDSQSNRRYRRMLWASVEYAKAHDEVTTLEAYKALDRMLAEGGR